MQNLDNIELLDKLPPEKKLEISSKCNWKKYTSGSQILEKSSTSRDIFFVVSGSVNVVNYGVSGREVAYATVEAGQYFGELSAIDGKPRSANIIANKECLLASLSPENFNELLLEHPEVMMLVMQRLARIIRINDDRILDLSTLGAVQRVCQELLRMATPDPVTPGSWLIYPMPTQSVIASRVSTTRETVARVIGQLTGDGLIQKRDKSMYLKDKAGIEEFISSLAVSPGNVPR
ncbi:MULTISPECIES: Crp/Fnr family transcriptional regulator [Sneathiella]|jgi:CRP-like cAMP-binding protein|uniref:Crp/Fnr family transcriptional regulator n=1 Tax=Sneathiella TaxID=510690 RepID=UPI00146E7917|nr:Crp/Fnr family transcriptional regulator [Sneathiella aquimaris]